MSIKGTSVKHMNEITKPQLCPTQPQLVIFLMLGVAGQYGGYYPHLTHLGGDDRGVVNLDKRGSSYHFRSFSYPFRSLQPAMGKRHDFSQAGTGNSWKKFRGMEFVGKRSGGKPERLMMPWRNSDRQKRPSLYLLNSLNV